MQRRTLIYSIVLVILGIAIAVVVVLILRKRAAGPEIIIVPSSVPSALTSQAPPKGTQTGEPTKPHDTYQTAPAWKEGDEGHVEPFFQTDPFHPFTPGTQ